MENKIAIEEKLSGKHMEKEGSFEDIADQITSEFICFGRSNHVRLI